MLGFENLVFSVFEFIHGLIETPKFKKTVKKFLDELIYFLVLYMQITEDQVGIILLKYCITLSPVSQEFAMVGVKREGRGGFKATGNADRNVSAFQSIANQKELLVIAVLYTSVPCDWVKNPSLISQPIRRNQNLSRFASTFSRACQWLHVGCMYSVISQPIRRKENLSRLARTFSRACQWLHVFASRSDWLIWISSRIVIGHSYLVLYFNACDWMENLAPQKQSRFAFAKTCSHTPVFFALAVSCS